MSKRHPLIFFFALCVVFWGMVFYFGCGCTSPESKPTPEVLPSRYQSVSLKTFDAQIRLISIGLKEDICPDGEQMNLLRCAEFEGNYEQKHSAKITFEKIKNKICN